MKKAFAIVALIAAMFVAGNVQAQTTIYATYSPETFVGHYTSDTKTDYQGFSVGFSQNLGLYKGIGVAVGAQFRMNMKNYEDNVLLGKVKDTQTLIDVPVLFNYKFDITRAVSVAPFVGPMLSFGLTGKTQITENLLNTVHEYNWYGEDASTKRFNLYAVFGADVKFNNFNLFGGYRLGLLDIDTFKDTTMKTNGFFVGLGYTL